jgi:hypothetical protein
VFWQETSFARHALICNSARRAANPWLKCNYHQKRRLPSATQLSTGIPGEWRDLHFVHPLTNSGAASSLPGCHPVDNVVNLPSFSPGIQCGRVSSIPERSGWRYNRPAVWGVLCFLCSLCFLIPLPVFFGWGKSAVTRRKSAVFPRRPNFELINLVFAGEGPGDGFKFLMEKRP